MITYAFVFARGGSKGVPGKNIRFLGGTPLLGHALIVAGQVSEIERCFVSTDNGAIAAVARKYGATVIERPPELAQDTSPEWLAWQHAVSWVRQHHGSFDRFISLPSTAPLRIAKDVRNCLAALDPNTDAVVTMTASQRNPWFNMVRADEYGRLNVLMQNGERYIRRQEAPQVYDLTTQAYVTRPTFILGHQSIWDGRVRGVVVPHERAIDIDTEFDLKIADFLMRERLQEDQKKC